MTISKISTLVSTTWLREQIVLATRASKQIKGNLRVIDTSWMPEPEIDGYKLFYKESHIPTAVHFDLKKISPTLPGAAIKFPIPDSNFFQEYVEDLGISNHTHVIAYDRFNMRPSFRAWFLFRVFGHNNISVLNGGLRQWISDGFHTTTEEPNVEKGVFKPQFRPELLVDFPQMVSNVRSQAAQVVDARGAKGFNGGTEDNPGGHMPGAINIPFDTLFNEDGTMKSVPELKKMLKDAGVDPSKPLISSCQTGMTACALAAAAFRTGIEQVPLYNGSFTEWLARADQDLIVKSQSPSKKE